ARRGADGASGLRADAGKQSRTAVVAGDPDREVVGGAEGAEHPQLRLERELRRRLEEPRVGAGAEEELERDRLGGEAEELAEVAREGGDLVPLPVALERERDDDVRGEHERRSPLGIGVGAAGGRDGARSPARALEGGLSVGDAARLGGEATLGRFEKCVLSFRCRRERPLLPLPETSCPSRRRGAKAR